MVELADSLDSGSSVHYGRAGSSPASRTMKRTAVWLSFFVLHLAAPGGGRPFLLLGGVREYVGFGRDSDRSGGSVREREIAQNSECIYNRKDSGNLDRRNSFFYYILFKWGNGVGRGGYLVKTVRN